MAVQDAIRSNDRREDGDSAAFRCRVCGNAEGNRPFVATEMAFGTGERFDYVECGRCGTLQIARFPDDLARHYGGGYYSFAPPYRSPPLRRWLKRRLAAHVLGRRDPVGRLVAAVRPVPRELEWVRRAGVDDDAAILDVGAGSGQLLVTLRELGFRRLLGIDPFVDREVAVGGGIRVLRRRIEDVEGRFDLVMFHHSFEHRADPAAARAAARDRLSAGGCVLIRTPIAAESWRAYGPHWVELDAPRHLHVFTREGIGALARRARLEVFDVAFDTTAFELWGSEQYARGIPLRRGASGLASGRDLFTAAEWERFAARARELNESGGAGRGAFWLRPTGDAHA